MWFRNLIIINSVFTDNFIIHLKSDPVITILTERGYLFADLLLKINRRNYYPD